MLKIGKNYRVVVKDHSIPFGSIVKVIGFLSPLYQKYEVRVLYQGKEFYVEENQIEYENSMQEM